MQLSINIPFRPAYVNDRGIQPPVPQTVVTLDTDTPTLSWMMERVGLSCTSTPAPWPIHPQYRPHTISDGHRIQRIAGLPLSFVEPMPRYANDGIPGTDSLIFDEPVIPPAPNDLTPLDRPLPDDITLDDHAMPDKPSDYDGFPVMDYDPERRLPRGKHSRPVTHDPDDLERMADQILDADAKGLLRTIKPMRVAGLPPADERGWRYLPHTYRLGHKPCPRCHGSAATTGSFATSTTRRCHYCKGAGGWAITRTRMTPWHPDHGFALTPPRLDGPVHSTHWRIRGPYYGDQRVKQTVNGKRPTPSDAVYDEIRRRHFAYETSRQLSQLATIDYAAAKREAVAA